ncbi:hypothetical protein GCM10010495_76830 [Kitasatospora herbaricolor]|uniref:hypothetical protein n=1 Tax=Kitasatospora herbaricolor TaxID=68217 RepID=UPI00174A66F6|nr:hypothetical protein [Kitasatospora herbaricolor]MDQ0313379.1 hypothetical protein [Kitasatospora herbaricolor]GGV47766.1 hypothetical protein GCM10010495_76830 [Kitasatospora herbaricolor]
MVTAVGYAYPWDFTGDPAAADRARDVGVDVVALAAAYHSTRAATPHHPHHRIVDAQHAACYLPVRRSAWSGRRLVPATAGWTGTPDSFRRARGALAAAGIPVWGWTVLTHNSLLGRANRDLTVHNAFGESYAYALCPQAPEVIEYCAMLIREVVVLGEVDGLVLEACGPMGVEHGGHHDKIEFAGWTTAQRQLLSLCFCRACRRSHLGAGVDGDRLAARVRAAVGAGPAPASVEEALGTDTAREVQRLLRAAGADFRRRMTAAARDAAPDIRITVHGSADSWATGSFPSLYPAAGEGVDAVVANCWPGVQTGESAIRQLAAIAGTGTAVGGYVRPETVRPVDGGSLRELAKRYVDAGLTELHLYHLGLVPQEGLDVLRDLVAEVRACAGDQPAQRTRPPGHLPFAG